jgi:hypothetical protein
MLNISNLELISETLLFYPVSDPQLLSKQQLQEST